MLIMTRKQKPRHGIGKRLTELRKAKGWTQTDAAIQIGVHMRTYQAWELGTHGISRFVQLKICQVFNVDKI